VRLSTENEVTEVDIQVDSPVVAGHLMETYTIKSARLRVLVDEVKALLNRFERHTFRRGDRSENTHADRLANEGMDSSTASMFTIHLDLPGTSASATCSKCLGQREVRWTTEEPTGTSLWGWMVEHAKAGHEL
jgi:hypothetical protein